MPWVLYERSGDAGVLDRMYAIDSLLTRRPSWKGRLVFIQAAAPTRTKLSAYSSLQKEAERLASNVDALNLALRGIGNSDTRLTR